jgi:uncharacterized protein (DUF433 family)
MDDQSLLNRITIIPTLCHGKPTIRGLRYTVQSILEYLASGMSFDEILADFEDLQEDDLKACLMFAAKMTEIKSITPLVA